MTQLEIIPGIRIGFVRLGMSPAEVSVVFSEPTVYEKWMGGNLNDALLFRGLRLHFDKCDSRRPLENSRLNCIVVVRGREDATLWDKPIGDWTKEAALQRLREESLEPQVLGNGDLEVPKMIGLHFDEGGRLELVEVFRE